MDTPACPRPGDPRQQEILDSLILIRDKLLLLKCDDTTHIKSQDVLNLYDELLEQVRQLGETNALNDTPGETQLDRVLESCFQLISLAFMTTGRNNEAPAAFAMTSTTRRILDRLMEVRGMCSMTDLKCIAEILSRLDDIVQDTEGCNEEGAACQKSPYVVALLQDRLEQQWEDVQKLHEILSTYQGDLAEVHERLIAVLRKLASENTRSKFSAKHVARLMDEIKSIDSLRVDGNFVTADNTVPEGNDDICQLLEYARKWADLIWEHQGVIPAEFQPTYDALVGIRNQLEKLLWTQTWSMRETDLYNYQRQLDRLDEAQKNGRWVDGHGNPASDYVQATFVSLIRKSYVLIFHLIASSEPVSEALITVLNQIQTFKCCLIEVKEVGGVDSMQELYPYMMKLNSIQKMRNKDGKFEVDGDIPYGQIALNEKLLECERLVDELRRDMEALSSGEQK